MFIMPRKVPLIIIKKEALLRGLFPHHKKRLKIEENLNKRKRGFKGEQNLDYHLSFLPEKEYFILCDINLIAEGKPFQIDTLILSPHLIFIIESKNFFGKLFFDQHTKQMIRTFKNDVDSFSDPITQTNRQKTQFLKWLKENGIKPYPIETLVAIGDPSTMLQTNPGMHQIFRKILQAEQIPERIIELNNQPREKLLTPYMMQKISELIINQQQYQADPIDILKRYSLTSADLHQGVRSPTCTHIPIQRVHGSWYCPQCRQVNKLAHQETIQDYLHLFNTITNKQCRELLLIPSINMTTRLLREMNLTHKGSGKATTYSLPPT